MEKQCREHERGPAGDPTIEHLAVEQPPERQCTERRDEGDKRAALETQRFATQARQQVDAEEAQERGG
ncbi:MAG: hypothetical protein RKL32_22100 [Gammaproteobacteria bacterium]